MKWLTAHKAFVEKVCTRLAIVALAVVVAYLFHVIQNSRLEACTAQNQRHANTVSVLKTVIATAEADQPKLRRQVQASERSTLLLINALAPHQNCTSVVSSGH